MERDELYRDIEEEPEDFDPAAMRRKAAEELAAEFGTPVEEWLV